MPERDPDAEYCEDGSAWNQHRAQDRRILRISIRISHAEARAWRDALRPLGTETAVLRSVIAAICHDPAFAKRVKKLLTC